VDEYKKRQVAALEAIEAEAEANHLAMMRSPVGIMFVPERDGDVMSPEAFNALPDDERQTISKAIASVEEHLQERLRAAPQWDKEQRDRMRELDQAVTAMTVQSLLKAMRAEFADLADVTTHLAALEKDIVDNVGHLLEASKGSSADRRARCRACAACSKRVKDGSVTRSTSSSTTARHKGLPSSTRPTPRCST
jgi:hypothetical protein